MYGDALKDVETRVDVMLRERIINSRTRAPLLAFSNESNL